VEEEVHGLELYISRMMFPKFFQFKGELVCYGDHQVSTRRGIRFKSGFTVALVAKLESGPS